MFVVCTATALGATVAVAAPLPVAAIASSKDQPIDEEEKIDFSPFHSPPCPSAGLNSRLFVLPRPYWFIVVLLLRVLNDDCCLHLPSCSRGRSYKDESRDEEEKPDFSFSSSFLLKRRPGQ